MEVKIGTFNIQSCKDYILKEFNPLVHINAIKKFNPDILSLNEVRGEGEDKYFFNQTRTLARGAGYKYYFFGQAIILEGKGPYGNAIISKYPILDLEVIKIPDPLVYDEDTYYESRCIIKAKIKINDSIIYVILTHMGLAKSEEKNATDTVIKIIEPLINNNKKIILLGDFNMEPDNLNLDRIREYLDDTTDLMNKEPTFPSVNPIKKIDYIFYKNVIVKSAKVEKIVASDHYPVSAVIDL